MATADTISSIIPNATAYQAGPQFTPTPTPYDNRDGFDLVWRQEYLQDQISHIEDSIRSIEQNANLSDTEKMYSMQMAMNTWSAVTNLRTNIMKSVSDTLKAIVRNVA